MRITAIDLQCEDIVELFHDANFRIVLSDEFDINTKDNTFVTDEDAQYVPFNCVTRIWRLDPSGNYQIIYNRKGSKYVHSNGSDQSKFNISEKII